MEVYREKTLGPRKNTNGHEINFTADYTD